MNNLSRWIMVAGLAGIAVVGAYLIGQMANPPIERGMQIAGEAKIGGPFSLIDQTGAPVDESLLVGQSSFVFFGFTHCPDFCPMGLQKIAIAKEMVGARADDVQTVFISIDPERDTPESLASYIDTEVFPKPIKALTGTPDAIAAAAEAFIAQYERAPGGDDDDYLMNHTTFIYLMGPDGVFDRLFLHSDDPAEIAEGLRQHLVQKR
jgi:protein SCO1